MNVVGIAVFAATIVVASCQGGPYCDPRKGLVYTDCVRCSSTCNDFWYDPYKVCVGCNPGCDCADINSYIRNDGYCVPSDQCFNYCNCNSVSTSDSAPDDYVSDDYVSDDYVPARCDVNEEYSTCGGCEPTCEIPKPEVCAAVCRIGCFCKSGYLRNSNGVCVKPEECDTGNYCGPDQKYVSQIPCKNTCKEYLYADVCGSKGPGCTCAQPGFYILESNGLCVQPLICETFYGGNPAPALTDDSESVRCGVNEKYLTCGGCEPTCENPNPEVCAAVCVRGCFCNNGYLRNSNGVCVRPEECDTGYYCGPDQIYVSQIPCKNTCKEYLYVDACGSRGPGCTCAQPGFYILESNGLCVQPLICETFYGGNAAPALTDDSDSGPPLIVCDATKGQTFYEILPCKVTCRDYLSASDVCVEFESGCACAQEGYYILEDIGFCVPGEVCSAYYSRPAALSCP